MTTLLDKSGATGVYHIVCTGPDGEIKWKDEVPNLVVNQGLQLMAATTLTAGTQIVSWYIGLYGSSATNTPAASNTMASHSSWTESTPYSNATRPQCVFATPTTANPSVATNSASPAVFSINATATIGGAFLVSNNTKGGSSGTLFSAAAFTSPGDRAVASGDIVNITYTLSVAG